MNTKLTLNIDDSIVERAKNYAQRRHHTMALRYFSFVQRNEQRIEAYASPVAYANAQ